MRNYLFIIILLISYSSFSQIKFEPGYIILNSGNKIDCLIKNLDWKNIPKKIIYKKHGTNQEEISNLKNIKEFSINGYYKYIKRTVDIDISSDQLDKLSTNRNPIFNKKTLFLKVLVEGNISLYEYSSNKMKRFFFSVDNNNITQLIYKTFKINKHLSGKNEGYKQQLFNNLKCSNITLNFINKTNYTQNNLIKIITKYNSCINGNNVNYTHLQKQREIFNLSTNIIANKSSLSLSNKGSIYDNIHFKDKFIVGLGFGAEFFLPFNKNKWSIVLEPNYLHYKSNTSKKMDLISGGKLISVVDYSSIDLPIGLRYHFLINQKSKIFINTLYNYNFSLKSSLKLNRIDGSTINSMKIIDTNNLSFGLGYNYKFLSIEYRIQTPRTIVSIWKADLYTTSFILSYKLFKNKID